MRQCQRFQHLAARGQPHRLADILNLPDVEIVLHGQYLPCFVRLFE
jgi:hypothetical protein